MKTKYNHLQAIDAIMHQLQVHGLKYDANYLQNEVRSSATGGELCSRVGSTLLAMKNKQEVKEAIGPHIDEFVDFCYSQGLLVKSCPFYSTKQKEFTIDGKEFEDLKGFYNAIGTQLTEDNNWGKNWNALNDILYGGFIKTEYCEPFKLIWKNSVLSEEKLRQDYNDIVSLIKEHDHIELIEE